MVLAEYTEFTGNFPAIAAQCLQQLPSSSNKFTYKCDGHIFNFLVEDGYAYCVVAKESVGKQISIALLERIKADFKKRYGGGKAGTAVAKSLNKEFGPLMKEHMQYIMDHADEIEKLLKVKAQVSEVKSVMLENIDKTIERGVNLNNLNDKIEELQNSAQEFKNKGTQIRRKMWYQNMKINLVVLGIILFLVLVIWLSVCRGFNCTNYNIHTPPSSVRLIKFLVAVEWVWRGVCSLDQEFTSKQRNVALSNFYIVKPLGNFCSLFVQKDTHVQEPD